MKKFVIPNMCLAGKNKKRQKIVYNIVIIALYTKNIILIIRSIYIICLEIISLFVTWKVSFKNLSPILVLFFEAVTLTKFAKKMVVYSL